MISCIVYEYEDDTVNCHSMQGYFFSNFLTILCNKLILKQKYILVLEV